MNNPIQPLALHPDRLFSSDTKVIEIARALYAEIKKLTHYQPSWSH